jgi:hypothetical protein
MRTLRIVLIALALVLASTSAAQAGVRIGVGIGIPIGAFFGPCWGCYRPYPVYVAPAPIIVQPAPVVQAVPATPVCSASASVRAETPPPPAVAEAPEPATLPATPARYEARGTSPAGTGEVWDDLNDPDERVRAEAMMRLGRSKNRRAVGPLQKALREDASPAARDAAARALGLIGAPASLNALQKAAQADDDRDVRHSAAFAAEVIRANLGR